MDNKNVDMPASYLMEIIKVASSFIRNFNYVIIDNTSKHAAIVDPAWDQEEIVAVLEKHGVKLTSILLTHSHHDHVNLVSYLLKRYNPQVFMSAKEIDFYNFRCKNLNKVNHLDRINLGATPIYCLVTPGHTAGGVCFLTDQELFTGDTIFIEGCGICTCPGGCPEQMYESIQLIKRFVSPNVRIYPGHSFGRDPGYRLKEVMEDNIYFLIDKKDQFVSFRMRKNQKGLFAFR